MISLTSIRPSEAVKKITYPTLVVFLAFAAVYVPLLLRVGVSLELHTISTFVFALLSVFVTLGLFRDRSEDAKDVGNVKVVFGGLVVAVAVEESLLNSVLAVYGFAFSILGLMILPVLAIRLGQNNNWLRVALEAVALIFATRVVLSPFSNQFLDQPTYLPTIYTLILVALVLYLTHRRIPAKGVRIGLGSHSLRFHVGVGLTLGVVLGTVEYIVLKPPPLPMANANLVQMIVYIAITVGMMVGVTEELLFRGLLQSSLEKIMQPWQATGVAAAMFGLMHVGWMNPLEILLAYGAGVVFGYLAIKTESLITPIIAHGFGNFVLYVITLNFSG